jgi:hypothetical protein
MTLANCGYDIAQAGFVGMQARTREAIYGLQIRRRHWDFRGIAGRTFSESAARW